MLHYKQREMLHEQHRIQHEQRMKQLESEIESEIERSKERATQIENDILLIENETEQLRRENARLETLLSCVDRLCFPPASSSNPPPATESDCGSSWS
jgi:flagellar motility protein MotE (MotC chaperone)